MANNNNTEFDIARKRLKQAGESKRQQASRALKRQFARSGGIGSGAFIKQGQIARQQIGEQESRGLEGIESAERKETQRKREIQEGREFVAGESEKGRKFASGESALGRKFTGEQAALGRQFASTEAKTARDFDRQFKEKLLDFDKQTKQAALDLEHAKFGQEADSIAFNKQIALAELGKDTGLFSSLFGDDKSSGIMEIATLGFCFMKNTMLPMNDGTLKAIQDIELGDILKHNVRVNCIAQAFATEFLYEIDGEKCTGDHVILDKDNVWKFVKDIPRSERLPIKDHSETVVYPLNTDSGFYYTKSGNVSMSYMNVEGAISPKDELRILNKTKELHKKIDEYKSKSYVSVKMVTMNKQMLTILDHWYKGHNWAPLDQELYPYTGNFCVFYKNEPVAFSNYYETNSLFGIQGFTITDPNQSKFVVYKCLKSLFERLEQDQKKKGCKVIYYGTDKNSESIVKFMKKSGGEISSNGDGFVYVKNHTDWINIDCILDKDYPENNEEVKSNGN